VYEISLKSTNYRPFEPKNVANFGTLSTTLL